MQDIGRETVENSIVTVMSTHNFRCSVTTSRILFWITLLASKWVSPYLHTW